MFLKRVTISGLRASALDPIKCELPGRFSVIVGANNSGKTTIAEAIYWGHPNRFPSRPPLSSDNLGSANRDVSIAYSFESPGGAEGILARDLIFRAAPAPSWSRSIERSMGRTRFTRAEHEPEGYDQLRLVYIPATRSPIDELAGRESRVLIELLRAQNERNLGTRNLAPLRSTAQRLIDDLAADGLLQSVEGRVRKHLDEITGGVSNQFSFFGSQIVDDAFLARVLELLISSIDVREQAERLELSGLGYVHLLYIAVTLAAIPDPEGGTLGGQFGVGETTTRDSTVSSNNFQADETSDPAAADEPEVSSEAIEAESEAIQDSIYPEQFHVVVVIDEPESHLHPQLQYSLARYLKRMTELRPEIQIVVTTHSGDFLSAVDPLDLVVLKRNVARTRVSRTLKTMTFARDPKVVRLLKLHLNELRTSALFGSEVMLVEGVTDAILFRQFGYAWAEEDADKHRFVGALAIVPLGSKIGQWLPTTLATKDEEIVERLAIVKDSDLRTGAVPSNPVWFSGLDPTVAQIFFSHPTLEPATVGSNETLVEQVLSALGIVFLSPISSAQLDSLFRTSGKQKKAEYALEFAQVIALEIEQGGAVNVPAYLRDCFDFLYSARPVALP